LHPREMERMGGLRGGRGRKGAKDALSYSIKGLTPGETPLRGVKRKTKKGLLPSPEKKKSTGGRTKGTPSEKGLETGGRAGGQNTGKGKPEKTAEGGKPRPKREGRPKAKSI